jgi:acetyl-CoA synthetase
MKRLGVKTRQELWKYSVTHLDKFWEAVTQDLGFEWQAPYTKIRDSKEGIAWTKWFIDGKFNSRNHQSIARHEISGKH